MSLANFATPSYQAHNDARLSHLASLGLPIEGKRVLEVGSGPGDHTGFYLSRGCHVVALDGRQECIDMLRRFAGPLVEAHIFDMNRCDTCDLAHFGKFDVVHCYGLLYHLHSPAHAIAKMARVCSGALVLETCVSHFATDGINPVAEDFRDSTQAIDGRGCRPARSWVFAELAKHFKYVYQTRTQPKHPEFPTDWKAKPTAPLSRAVFVASRQPLDLPTLSAELLQRQTVAV